MVRCLRGTLSAVAFSAGLMCRYLPEEGTVTTIDRYEVMLKDARVNIKRMGLEDKIKKRIMHEVFRGKTDVYISFETFSAADVEVKLNEALAAAYIEKLKLIEEKFGIYSENKLELAAKFPDVITHPRSRGLQKPQPLSQCAVDQHQRRPANPSGGYSAFPDIPARPFSAPLCSSWPV